MIPTEEGQKGCAPKSRPDDWLLAQGERDGLPMLVRMACAYRHLAPLPDYDHHLIVSVRLRNPNRDGLPSSDEGDDLQALEQKLCSILESGNNSLCVLVITNNGLRDFIFYTRNAEGLKAGIGSAGEALRGFQCNLALELDQNWKIYQAFCRMLGER